MPPLIVSIDGNIGCGKSSIMRYLEKNFANYCGSKGNTCKICFLQEPVSSWESIGDANGKSIITHFYENNERYSFAFQVMAYTSRLSLLKEALKENYDVIISERSIYTDKFVFAKSLYEAKKMSLIEYIIYLNLFNEFSDIIKNIKMVYIRTSPEICDLRVQQRGRLGETIPIQYLKDCHHYHDIWLNNPTAIENGEILVINGNEETNTSQFIENKFYDDVTRKLYDFVFTL
jgi:deoxyadenosine/deoxycytidine kinase